MLKTKLQEYWSILKQTFKAWQDSSASRDSMALAYSAIFSLPGLLIIIIWIAGHFFGEEAIRGEISQQISGIMGGDAAQSIEEMITASMIDRQNWLMKLVGVISLLFGATTVFFLLQTALNDMWQVQAKPDQTFLKVVIDRATSLGIILIISLLLMVTMLLSTLLSLFNTLLADWLGVETYLLLQLANFVVGFLITVLIFAIIFKVLPDVRMRWKAVWPGAVITAVLFTIGKFLLSLYFAKVKPTSAFGTAGTAILIMMWVNYSCRILFFGATFTRIYAYRKGFQIRAAAHAIWKREYARHLKQEKS